MRIPQKRFSLSRGAEKAPMIGARASRTKKQRGGNQRRPLSSFPSLLSLSPFNHEKEAKTCVCEVRVVYVCSRGSSNEKFED
jgi:hypothetical protein